jgi:hypothetical protein
MSGLRLDLEPICSGKQRGAAPLSGRICRPAWCREIRPVHSPPPTEPVIPDDIADAVPDFNRLSH